MSQAPELTGFQEQAPYDERIDLRTDFVMVYGLNETTAERIERWRQAGYRIHLMTGISWGTYQDYLYGDWDGEQHWDDAQTVADGSPILHGKDIPYMVPTVSFTDYLVQKLRPVLDLGVEASTWRSRSSGPGPGIRRPSGGSGRPTSVSPGRTRTARPRHTSDRAS